MTRRRIRFLPRLGRSGVAAVEFGLIAPTFLLLVMALLDFGYAYSTQLRVVNATTAAAAYAFLNRSNVLAGTVTVPAYLADIKNVAQSSESFPTAPSVTTYYNNAPDAANAAYTYCVSGTPLVWTQESTVTNCPADANITSGVFVTITVTATFTPFFPTDRFFLNNMPITDSAIVRIQ